MYLNQNSSRKKQNVHAQVLGAQRDAEQLRQPHVQGADGVVAEVGTAFEKRNAKGDDDDARHHAHHPPAVGLHNAVPFIMILLSVFFHQFLGGNKLR